MKLCDNQFVWLTREQYFQLICILDHVILTTLHRKQMNYKLLTLLKASFVLFTCQPYIFAILSIVAHYCVRWELVLK